MADGVYTTAEVAEITGFTIRQLDHWDRQEMLVPTVQQAQGSGSRRLYAFADLVQLRFIRHLKDHGWSTQKIRIAISGLREVMNDPDPRKKAVLFDGKGTILALCKAKGRDPIVIDALSAGGQQVMEIVLETLEDEARHIAALFGGILDSTEVSTSISGRDNIHQRGELSLPQPRIGVKSTRQAIGIHEAQVVDTEDGKR